MGSCKLFSFYFPGRTFLVSKKRLGYTLNGHQTVTDRHRDILRSRLCTGGARSKKDRADVQQSGEQLCCSFARRSPTRLHLSGNYAHGFPKTTRPQMPPHPTPPVYACTHGLCCKSIMHHAVNFPLRSSKPARQTCMPNPQTGSNCKLNPHIHTTSIRMTNLQNMHATAYPHTTTRMPNPQTRTCRII